MFRPDFASLKAHQIKPHNGFALKVRLMASENEYIRYPAKGVLHVLEQGSDLSIIVAVFHVAYPDGRLGSPVVVRNPRFEVEAH
jgi:hypothetical protein